MSELNFTFCPRCGVQMNPRYDASNPASDLERQYDETEKHIFPKSFTDLVDYLRQERAELRAENEALRERSKGHWVEASKHQEVIAERLALAAKVERLLDARPITPGELLQMGIDGHAVPIGRTIATYADPKNWMQIYNGKAADGYTAKACEWAFIGPMRPGFELAGHALHTLHLIATEPPAVSLNALLKEHPVVKALVDVLEDTKKYGLRNPPNSWYIARDKALAALDNLK